MFQNSADGPDILKWPPEALGVLLKCTLEAEALLVGEDLARARLADVDDGVQPMRRVPIEDPTEARCGRLVERIQGQSRAARGGSLVQGSVDGLGILFARKVTARHKL